MDEVEKILSDEIKKNRSPSVVYSFFDQTRFIKSFASGYSDIEKGEMAGKATTYNAYSVTKTFTALAVLQLAQQVKLNLEDPVKDYLDFFPFNPEITIKQILSHSSGIPNPVPLAWIHLAGDDRSFSGDDFFRNILLKRRKNNQRINEKFSYSNLGYVLLGQLIEKVSGLRYGDYIQDNIIKPLGIPAGELGFEISDASRHARGYHKRISISGLILGFLIDKSKFMEKSGPVWKPFRSFYVNGPSYGGLIGTPDAFITYIRELLKPDSILIGDEYKEQLFTENITKNGNPTGMCLSWFTGKLNGHRYFTHAGGGGGYYCEIRIYPDAGRGSVIFFNRTGMSDQRFLDRVDALCLKDI